MPLGANQTANRTSDQGLMDISTDYVDFLHYVNNFNWSGVAEVDAIDDPFGNLFSSLVGSSATGLDPATFWLNFSGYPSSTFNVSPTVLNTSVVDTVSAGRWIWEAGKLRIPLYRFVVATYSIWTRQSPFNASCTAQFNQTNQFQKGLRYSMTSAMNIIRLLLEF